MYAARPARYTPLPRGETAADWRGKFREYLRKSKDSSLAALRSDVGDNEASRIMARLNELDEGKLQERFANWLEGWEECGTVTVQCKTNTTREIIFTALQVSPLIRVRSSLLVEFRSTMRARPRRGTARMRSPRTRGTRSSTRS